MYKPHLMPGLKINSSKSLKFDGCLHDAPAAKMDAVGCAGHESHAPNATVLAGVRNSSIHVALEASSSCCSSSSPAGCRAIAIPLFCGSKAILAHALKNHLLRQAPMIDPEASVSIATGGSASARTARPTHLAQLHICVAVNITILNSLQLCP